MHLCKDRSNRFISDSFIYIFFRFLLGFTLLFSSYICVHALSICIFQSDVLWDIILTGSGPRAYPASRGSTRTRRASSRASRAPTTRRARESMVQSASMSAQVLVPCLFSDCAIYSDTSHFVFFLSNH